MTTNRIAVLELASNRAHFIVDSLCQCGISPEKIDVYRLHEGKYPRSIPIAAISSGGPGSVPEACPGSHFGRTIESAHSVLTEWMHAGVPILAICLSHQVLSVGCGGTVRRSAAGEVAGFETVKVIAEDDLFNDIPGEFIIGEHHHDEVAIPPPGWKIIGRSASCHVEALRWTEGQTWAVQGHPELPAHFVQHHLLSGKVHSPGLRDSPGPRYEKHRLQLIKNFLMLASSRRGSALPEQARSHKSKRQLERPFHSVT